MSLLLLDLDNTVADRAAAFDHWANGVLARWAPGDPEAHGFLVSQDDEGGRPRVDFLQIVREHFDLRDPVDALLREYRAMTLDGFPPIDGQIHEKLRSLRETGWSIAVVTNGEDGVQQGHNRTDWAESSHRCVRRVRRRRDPQAGRSDL